jgi:hypothetical protein
MRIPYLFGPFVIGDNARTLHVGQRLSSSLLDQQRLLRCIQADFSLIFVPSLVPPLGDQAGRADRWHVVFLDRLRDSALLAVWSAASMFCASNARHAAGRGAITSRDWSLSWATTPD